MAEDRLSWPKFVWNPETYGGYSHAYVVLLHLYEDDVLLPLGFYATLGGAQAKVIGTAMVENPVWDVDTSGTTWRLFTPDAAYTIFTGEIKF